MDHLFSFVKRPIRAILSALLATILTAAMVGGSAQSVSAASGKYFYWANMNIGGIGRAATTPPNTVTSQFIKPNDPGAPSYGLASDGVYIYWSELGDSMSFISRAPINNPTAVEKNSSLSLKIKAQSIQ